MTTTERSGESAIGGKERTDAVWRDVHHGRVWRAQACRIVEESPETIVLWIPAGAPAKVPAGGLRIPGDEWTLEDAAPSSRPDLRRAPRPRALGLRLLGRGRRAQPLVRELRAATQPLAGRLRHVRREARPDRPCPTGRTGGRTRTSSSRPPRRAARRRRGPGRSSAGARGMAVPDRLGGLAAGSCLAGPAAPGGWDRV